MRSDIIRIDNQGNGFAEAIDQTRRVAAYRGLDHKDAIRLQLLAEEMLSLARSVTGEMHASFYLEAEGTKYQLCMTTNTVMDREKRLQLIASTTARKNDAAKGLLGRLRDVLEEAMASEVVNTGDDIPYELRFDIIDHPIRDGWDGYERSVLKRLADDVKIGIRGGTVEITVTKDFA